MSYCVLYMKKVKGGSALGGMQKHLRREMSNSINKDIDQERTHLNFSTLGDYQNATPLNKIVDNFIKKKVSSDKAIRKDAVLVNSFIVSSDNEFFKDKSLAEIKQFFIDASMFFFERYDGNIAYADIHMDETTPHMHIGIIPITKDGRLSSKEIFDRNELRSLQTDFYKRVGSRWGLQRGKEGSTARHLDTNTYKQNMAYEQKIAELEQKIYELEHNIPIEKEKVVKNEYEPVPDFDYEEPVPRIDLMKDEDFEKPNSYSNKSEEYEMEF